MKHFFILVITVFCSTTVFAQNTPKFINKADTAALHKLALEAKSYFTTQRNLALGSVQRNKLDITKLADNGGTLEPVGIEPDGKPLFFGTSNLNAAKTVSTDKVWPGGSAGLSLTGSGMTIGVWDGGKILSTHDEFGGRAIQADAAVINGNSNHATHVSGTMIAAGVNPSAKGMAYQANLRAHDWAFDVMEMANEAADGQILSNHSYKHISGWEGRYWYGDTTISRVKDYKFGFYGTSTRQFDLICNYAPYYLPVVAASNDRNNTSTYPGKLNTGYCWNGVAWVYSSSARPPDGPYDCIPTFCTAKNILTVGNVNDITAGYASPANVVLVSSSSCGPTDDGRIKPDIVANGQSLLSSVSTGVSAYSTLTGTSMATPNTSGSLLLVQQHHHNFYGQYLKSATLKALVINTADEAGAGNGPDYQFGWGLLNTKKACDAITNNDSVSIIKEISLKQGQTFSMDFYADGTTAIRSVIAWNDPAASISPWVNDPTTPKLVNNLNMVLTKSAATWNPYILNPSSPSSMATTGSNSLDNVERIDINTPAAGVYTLTVTHSGVLQNGEQEFSLVITGIRNYAPKQFKAVVASESQIDLSWELNSSKPVIIATSLDGVFGNPVDGASYTPGSTLPGGGTILYIGSATTFAHSSLTQHSTHFYRIWSQINGTPDYSEGLPANATTWCSSIALPYTQSFDTTAMPPCWQILKSGNAEGWTISNTNYGNGTPTELYHTWEDLYTNTSAGLATAESRAVLPPVNTLGMSSLTITFTHYYKDPTWSSYGTATIKVQSSSDGINWTTEGLSHASHTGSLGPEIKQVLITNNLNQPKTFIAFTITGDLLDFWYWAIDDIYLDQTIFSPKAVSLKVLHEGLWNGSGLSKAKDGSSDKFAGLISDRLSINLHDALAYSTIHYSLDSINLASNGQAMFLVPYNYNGSYYLSVKHRNLVETVSASPISFAGTTVSYDFSTSASQAFGGNQKEIAPGIFGLYCGDADGDGQVDEDDILNISSDATGFNSGYLSTDLNGDGIVDALDLILLDNNARNLVGSITPP